MTFLNYGYEDEPPLGLPLDASDEPNRCSINLYHQVAMQVDLTGKKVLEASCGHGCGASYLTRTLKPASYTGLDYNPDGIAYCRKRHTLLGLDFVHGDAENPALPGRILRHGNQCRGLARLPSARFLSEVARVLRLGGHFLYADFRSHNEFPGWDAALADMPLRQASKRVINDSVVRSLDNSAQRKLDLISHQLPTFLRPFSRHFAGVPGTGIYNVIKNRDAE